MSFNVYRCKPKIKMKKTTNWTKDEDKILLEKAKEFNYKNWSGISDFLEGRTAIQCCARYKRIQPGLTKGAWSIQEDAKLMELYKKYGRNWSLISKEMTNRTGKQIRDRFINSLDDNLKRDKFSKEEDNKIIKWYHVYGNSWCKIAKKLKGRTGDMVKNRYYSSLKKIIAKELSENKNININKDEENDEINSDDDEEEEDDDDNNNNNVFSDDHFLNKKRKSSSNNNDNNINKNQIKNCNKILKNNNKNEIIKNNLEVINPNCESNKNQNLKEVNNLNNEGGININKYKNTNQKKIKQNQDVNKNLSNKKSISKSNCSSKNFNYLNNSMNDAKNNKLNLNNNIFRDFDNNSFEHKDISNFSVNSSISPIKNNFDFLRNTKLNEDYGSIDNKKNNNLHTFNNSNNNSSFFKQKLKGFKGPMNNIQNNIFNNENNNLNISKVPSLTPFRNLNLLTGAQLNDDFGIDMKGDEIANNTKNNNPFFENNTNNMINNNNNNNFLSLSKNNSLFSNYNGFKHSSSSNINIEKFANPLSNNPFDRFQTSFEDDIIRNSLENINFSFGKELIRDDNKSGTEENYKISSIFPEEKLEFLENSIINLQEDIPLDIAKKQYKIIKEYKESIEQLIQRYS